MHRREFTTTLTGAFAGIALPSLPMRGTRRFRLADINTARLNGDIKALSQFGANPEGGVSRVAYSDADRAGRAWAMNRMRAAGLEVTVDVAGNIFGRRAGTVPSLKPIVFGSHIDSVPGGGNFDGPVGSLAGIEIAHSFTEQNVRTRHPLEIVIWANEEGGLYGSRAVSGQLTPAELKNRSSSGKTIEEGIAFIGGDPARLADVRRSKGSIACYFELHIEQGGTLEREKLNIGIVEGIVGIRQWEVTVTGVQNHAGTTPMDQRHDALLAAARFVEMVHRTVRAEPGRQVGTVGRMQAFPGAPNVVPGRVLCTLELRDLDAARISRLFDAISGEAKRIGDGTGTSFAFRSLHEDIPAPSDPKMREIISMVSTELGYTTRLMPSGAGHDAQAMAQIGPMGMIFIPSIGGISHSPKEYSTPEDIARGARVLMGAVLQADRAS
ncbi:MAG TPA: Zn-dependent hydrolase [Gemmatimonadaceae bacterium]|nr:Zn-dependent hydrolase [Gemmatimonadaceae bacterium]